MHFGGSRPRPPTSTRMGRASGTPRSRRSRSLPRTAPNSLSAILTRWPRSWTSGSAPTCARPGTSRVSTRCHARAPTCRTISTRGSWSCPPSIRTARSPAARPSGGADYSRSRGNTPRLYRNTLVFLAADKVRLQDLDEAVRRFLAWESILAEKESLNLDPHQVRQAETQKQAADSAMTARLPEAYQWLLVPEQGNPQAPITWQAIRLSGGEAIAVRASKRLRSDESLVTSLGSTILRKHLEDVPLWRGEHVAVKQLVEDFARYLYLPRLAGPEVLVQAIRDGLALLTWQTDTFAYAESYDEGAARYRGLRGGQVVSLSAESAGVLVRPDVARQQMDAETRCRSRRGGGGETGAGAGVLQPDASRVNRRSTRCGRGPAASPVPRHRAARSRARRPRCEPHRRRGDRAPRGAGGRGGHGHPRD